MNRPEVREVLDCGSPRPLWHAHALESARGLAQSKTLPHQRHAPFGSRSRCTFVESSPLPMSIQVGMIRRILRSNCLWRFDDTDLIITQTSFVGKKRDRGQPRSLALSIQFNSHGEIVRKNRTGGLPDGNVNGDKPGMSVHTVDAGLLFNSVAPCNRQHGSSHRRVALPAPS